MDPGSTQRKAARGPGQPLDIPDSKSVRAPTALIPSLEEYDRLSRFQGLLKEVLETNRFQQRKIGARTRCGSVNDFLGLPFLIKEELAADAAAHPPFGTNLTYPLERYSRYHQTSGTMGTPLRVLDTPESWDWWGRCWLEVLQGAGVTSEDRVFFAFSFAPFIGFWSAYHGTTMLGALSIPAGGADSRQRLRMILDSGATVLLATPTYALHLAEVARREGMRISDSQVRITIHAGEPGASVPGTRRRIGEAWEAQVFDHAGASEIGAYGLGCPEGKGVYVNEKEFIAEVLDPVTHQPVREGETGELVITNLGRAAWPVIRYRTGDIVRPRRKAAGDGLPFLFLEGGILGRSDDRMTIRGVNVYPSAIEDVIRHVAGTAEYRLIVTKDAEMDHLTIELEGNAAICEKVKQEIRQGIGIRVEVRPVESDSLPRWEAKARRVVDRRNST